MAIVYSLVCWGGHAGKGSWTVNTSTDRLTLTNNGLRNGLGVRFSGGTLPSVTGTALDSSTTYYAKEIDYNTAELYRDSGLTQKVDFTSAGSGWVLKSAYYLGLSDYSRWGGATSRIYDGIQAWNTGRSSVAALLDTEYCEIGETFTEARTSGNLEITVPSAKNIIAARVAGVLSAAFHNGTFGSGYLLRNHDPYATVLRLTRLGDEAEGIELFSSNSGYGTPVGLFLTHLARGLRVLSRCASSLGTGVLLAGTRAEINSSVVIGWARGIDADAYQRYMVADNNVVTKCVTSGISFGTAGGGNGNQYYVRNNVALGNGPSGTGPNWTTGATNLTHATNNLGLTGEAWLTTGGVRLETAATAPFASIFLDYNNNDLRPASILSPLVEGGAEYVGILPSDIRNSVKPAYTGSAYGTAVTAGAFVAGLSYTIASVGTTDFTLIGASANTVGVVFKATGAGSGSGTATLNAQTDVGAYEFDLGYGTWPTSDYYGIAFTGLLAGSLVKVFNTGTDTERFSTTNSGTSETWSVNSTGSATVDYVVLKAGFEPIRVTGVTVTGGPSGIISVPVEQVIARWYQTPSGLTLGTNAFANASTKRFGLAVASTLQNFASYLMDRWIALGGTGQAYANKAFPISANGPNSFSWRYGWEADSGYPNTISLLSRDGMRYLDANGTPTASWAAILSVGVSSGMQVRFQQTDGGTTQSAAVTSGNMDQLVQIYGDATHGNFDRTGYLVLKVQEQGYDQAEADAVALYGTLEDQLYVVGLAPTANGIAAANPDISAVTITDHGASPVTWNGQPFSITITDSGTTSGQAILQAIRYAQETGGTFQGKDAFNWHDLVQVNGDKFKGVRDAVYGDVGAALKGVRVLRGSGAHPDVTHHTADNGSVVVTAASGKQSVTVNGLVAGSRVQIYDLTNAAELANEVSVGSSVAWVDPSNPVADRAIRVRITWVSGATAKKMIAANIGTCGTTPETVAVSYLAAQENDATYNANAIDGSAVTGVTINDTTNRMEITASRTWAQLYAYHVYWLHTATGIQDDFAFMAAIDPANYLVFDGYKLKNTGAGPITISGGFGREATTGTIIDIIDTTGGMIFPLVDHVVSSVVTVGGVNVITGDIATVLAAIPSEAENAAAVLAAAQVAPIHASGPDIQRLRKLLGNKFITNPDTGIATLYDDDGVTVLVQGQLYEDAAGTIPYRGKGAERRERLT